MEKKLLRILLLIPILVIFIPIKNVYADDSYDIYFSSRYGRFQWTSYDYHPDNLEFIIYDNSNINLHYWNSFSYNISYMNLYDNKNDLYYFIFFWYRNNNCNNDNIFKINSDSTLSCLVNDSWVSADLYNYSYTLISKTNKDKFLNNILNKTNSYNYYNDIYYLTQNSIYDKFISYLITSSNDLKLELLKDNDYIYFGDNKLSLVSEEPEEPEPEEPTIPPFNFNNNKYFVPNYHTGQCVEVLDKDTIRVFEDEFTDFYTDYYINSNYISKTGQVDIDYEKHCSSLEFTDIRYYGNDLPQILFILICVLTFTIGFPYVLYKRFRKR